MYNPGQLCCCIKHLNLRPTNGGIYKGQPTGGGTINAAAAETTLWRPFCKLSADSERLFTGEFNEADELKVPSKNGPTKLVAAAAKAILVQLPALLVQRQDAASTECGGQCQNCDKCQKANLAATDERRIFSENDGKKTEEEKGSAEEEEETERGRNEEEEEEREGQPEKESAEDKREQKVAMDDGPCGSNNINNKQYPRRCCCECAKNCDSCCECSNSKDGVAIEEKSAQKVPLKLFKPFFAKNANFGVFNSPPKQQIDFVNKASERRSSVDESFENLKQRLGEISHKLDFWKTNLLRKPEEEGERFSTDPQQANRADQLNMLKAVINKELSAISVTESLTKTILENGDADKEVGRGHNSTAQTEALLTSRTLPASTSTSPTTITTTTSSSPTTQQKIVTEMTKEVPTTTTMPTMIGQNVKNVTTDLLPGNDGGGPPQILQGPLTQTAALPPIRRVTEKKPSSPSPPPPSTLSPPQLELPTPPPYTAPNVPATLVVNTEVATSINGGTTTTPSSSARTTKLTTVSQRQQNADDINNEISGVISPSVMPTTTLTSSTTTASTAVVVTTREVTSLQKEYVEKLAGLTTDSNSSNMTTILLATATTTTTSSTNAKMFDEGKGTTAEKENNATMELFVDRMQFDENNLLEQIHNVNMEDPQITTNGRPISLVSSNFASENAKESKHQISQFNEHLPPKETHGT
uniref:CRC domain-containing protein n=1 Tax=Globodera pallida TaxID=36090 RepID=A0A183C210_GLOPA